MRLFVFVSLCSVLYFSAFGQTKALDSTYLQSSIDSSQFAESIRQEGHKLFKENKFEQALEKYKKALSYFEMSLDSVGVGKCYNNIGNSYLQLGDNTDAISAFYKAIEINKNINQVTALTGNYINLGTYYKRQEEFGLSLRYYKEAEAILEDNYNPQRLALVYIGIGNILSDPDYTYNNFDSAYYYYSLAIPIYIESNNKNRLSGIYNNIGVLLENKHSSDSALVYYSMSLEINKELENRRANIINYLNIGNIFRKQGNYGIALDNFNKGIKIAEEFNDEINYLNLLTNIIKCKIKLGDLDGAEKLFGEYNTLNDSIYDQEKARQLKELETIYETEKTGKELESQIRQTRAKTRLSYTFLALAIGIGIVSIVIILFFIQRQRFNQKLRNQEMDRIRKEQEIKELNAMMQGQEEERNRIAEDLHDRLGARLSAIKLLSEQEKNGNTNQLTEMLEASIKETREISHNLSTDMLTRFGLANAIRDLVNTVNSSNTIEGDFTTTNLEDRLPVELERPLFHMISELVNNTIKHAKATSFFIQLTRDDDENVLSLLYEDDGRGFDFESVAKNGMGMKNLRARVEGLHGELTIDTSPGNGMHVMANIPMSMA
mgnify:CR=1 FL=1